MNEMRIRDESKSKKVGHLFCSRAASLIGLPLLVLLLASPFPKGNAQADPIRSDFFTHSGATVEIQSPLGTPFDVVTVGGYTTVNVDLGSLGDRDSDGLEELQTEMTVDWWRLYGTSSRLGPIYISLRSPAKRPFQHTLGEIEENSNIQVGRLDLLGDDPPLCVEHPSPPIDCVGTTADSFFDLFFQLRIESSGMVLHNEDPKHMAATITSYIPASGEAYESPDAVRLYDETGNPTDVWITAMHYATNVPGVPMPIQPFGPRDLGGLSTTQLGQDILDYTVTDIIRGERGGLSSLYTGGWGWGMNFDANIPDGTNVGSVISSIDANCMSTGDADVGKLAKTTSPTTPYEWYERTTAVTGTSEEYLIKLMPPVPWLLRHRADTNNVWLFGIVPYATNQVLNTVYTSVPFSPLGTLTATTRLGGGPVFPILAAGMCQDSPHSTTSIAGTVTTAVYSTPPLAGYDGNSDGLDDKSGLYPRWTAFQSDPDDRMSYKSPPSIASDTGYVERTIDLQCYWLDGNGCATCDANGDGYTSATESRNDPNMPAGIDADGDCLANAADAQPGQPTDADDSLNGTLCPIVPYSEMPNLIQYDTATDRDCDGLVDGVEVAWGSNPAVADTDGDSATDFVEMFQFTNPTVQDTDGDGYKDSPAAAAYQNVNPNFDNCPSVANPTQANNDGKRRDNGSQIPGNWASNPTQDKMGDACDPDDDNDMAVDVAELAKGTNPMVADTDGDRCLDGVEGYLDKDPLSNTSKCPASLNSGQLKFFRACRWNEPPNGHYGGGMWWSDENDGLEDNIEYDPDGDGLVCQTGTTINDTDNDDGTSTGAPAPVEIVDNVEIMGYGTQAANKDSDGDGCTDWIEIVDVNGNRSAELLDVLFVAKRAFGLIPGSDSDPVLDIDKNGPITILDALVAAKNSSLVKSHSPCASEG